MLDAAFIRENLEAVKANCVNRLVTVDVDRIVNSTVAARRWFRRRNCFSSVRQ